MSKNNVVVTGLGMCTAIGDSVDSGWAAMLKGENGIRPISRYDTTGMKTTFGGVNPNHDHLGASRLITEQMMQQVVNEVIKQAGSGFERMYYCLPNGEFDWEARSQAAREENTAVDYFSRYFLESGYASNLAKQFEVSSTPILVSTACASSATALQLAHDTIKAGKAKRILVAASDSSLSREVMLKFNHLSALSTRNDSPETASRPFSDERDGFIMGEGAAAMVLEDAEYAQQRNAKVYATLAGCASTTDNYHRTRGNPDGNRILLAMDKAVKEAGISLEQISYVNAHGTSTPENDKLESQTISQLFGDISTELTAIKSMIGHTLNASGLIQAVATVKSIETGCIPPTINYQSKAGHGNISVIDKLVNGRAIEAVLSNSFGFGGQNVALVFTRS